ncbi:MAG: SMP-30/gluconolactonase/LRE family protein [Microbacterium sp.]
MSALTSPWRALADPPRELGEGARFVAGRFVFVDLLAGRVYETEGEPGTLSRELLRRARPIGALAPRTGARGWVAATGDGVALLGDEAASDVWLAHPAAGGARDARMNDACADRWGRFWAGTMPYESVPGGGGLVRVDPDGSTNRVGPALSIPNGPAFSPDGRTMYLADTPTGTILAFPLRGDESDPGEPTSFATVTGGGPDGMTVDAEGAVWVAVWGAAEVHRYGVDGMLLERIPLPCRQPTSVAISTHAPYRVLVTSATAELDAPGVDDGRTFVADTAVAGLPVGTFGG